MVSALDSGSSGPGSSPGRGHCVVFLGKTLCQPRCINGYRRIYCWGLPCDGLASYSGRKRNTCSRFMLLKPG